MQPIWYARWPHHLYDAGIAFVAARDQWCDDAFCFQLHSWSWPETKVTTGHWPDLKRSYVRSLAPKTGGSSQGQPSSGSLLQAMLRDDRHQSRAGEEWEYSFGDALFRWKKTYLALTPQDSKTVYSQSQTHHTVLASGPYPGGKPVHCPHPWNFKLHV